MSPGGFPASRWLARLQAFAPNEPTDRQSEQFGRTCPGILLDINASLAGKMVAYPLHVDLGDVGLPLEPWRGRGEEFGPSRAEATARVQAGGGGEIVMKVRIFVWEYHTDALRLADEVNECIKSCENLGDTVLDADVLTRPNPQASHGVEYLVVVKYEGHRRIISLPEDDPGSGGAEPEP